MADSLFPVDESLVASHRDALLQQASVGTDKADYAPGERVTITASGFEVGATIEFAIADDPSRPGDDGDADVYAPFSVTDGGEGDLDQVANGQVVTSWLVPTDNNGSGSGTPDALNATLHVTAKGSDGQVAVTAFTDGNQALWAWRNEPGPTLNSWDAGTTIQQSNSIYAEGEVIPFRWSIATGNPSPQLQEDVSYPLLLDWAYAGGTTSPQKLFFDYLTSYNLSEATSPAFGPGSGLSAGFLNGYLSSILFPNDTGDTPSNPATVAHAAGSMTLYNIGSLSFGSYLVDNVNSQQEDRQLQVTFTPSDNDSVLGEFLDVGLAWGGHLATQRDYGFQNGAASFPGASPKMLVDLNPSVSGDQTNLNINPNAIVPQGQITIIKDAIPNDSKDFGFTITGPTGANITPTFTLDDDSDPTLPSQITFFGLIEGVYTITEQASTGWFLSSISPVENGVEDTATADLSSSDIGAKTATITVANGEVWAVKFTNEVVNAPSIAIDKVFLNVNGTIGEAANSVGDVLNYTVTVTNTGNVTLTNVSVVDPLTGQAISGVTLAPGATNSYATSYTLTQADLDSQGGGDGDIDNTATADSNQTGPVSDSEQAPLANAPSIAIDKVFLNVNGTIGEAANSVGDVLNYTVTVTNTGNVTLTNVSVVVPLTGQAISGVTLAPGAPNSYATSYILTQDDLDGLGNAGLDRDIDNTATADSAQTDPVSDSAEVPLGNAPSIAVDKVTVYAPPLAGVIVGDGITGVLACDPIGWEYTVTSTGNVSLSKVILIDDAGTPINLADDFFPDYVSGDADGDTKLDPLETWLYRASGVAIAGRYLNIGTAYAYEITLEALGGPLGPVVGAPPVIPPTTIVDFDPSDYIAIPKIAIIKDVDANDDGIFADSETVDEGTRLVDYRFTFTAGDNGTPIKVNSFADATLNLAGVTDAELLAAFFVANKDSYELAPNASVSFEINNVSLTLDDETAGQDPYINTVTVNATDLEGTPKSDATASDSATINVTNATPSIKIVKDVDANKDGIFNDSEIMLNADSTATYRYQLTNTSPASTDPLTIDTLVDDRGTASTGDDKLLVSGGVIQPGVSLVQSGGDTDSLLETGET